MEDSVREKESNETVRNVSKINKSFCKKIYIELLLRLCQSHNGIFPH